MCRLRISFWWLHLFSPVNLWILEQPKTSKFEYTLNQNDSGYSVFKKIKNEEMWEKGPGTEEIFEYLWKHSKKTGQGSLTSVYSEIALGCDLASFSALADSSRFTSG